VHRLLREGGRAYLTAPERGNTLSAFLDLVRPLFKGQVEIKEVYSQRVWAAHQALLNSETDSGSEGSTRNSDSNIDSPDCNGHSSNSGNDHGSNINSNSKSSSSSYQPDIHYPKLVILTMSS
jgi:hypothetical protein